MDFLSSGQALVGADLPNPSFMVDGLLPGPSLSGLWIPLSDNTLPRHLSGGARWLYVSLVAQSSIGKLLGCSIFTLLAKMLTKQFLLLGAARRSNKTPATTKPTWLCKSVGATGELFSDRLRDGKRLAGKRGPTRNVQVWALTEFRLDASDILLRREKLPVSTFGDSVQVPNMVRCFERFFGLAAESFGRFVALYGERHRRPCTDQRLTMRSPVVGRRAASQFRLSRSTLTHAANRRVTSISYITFDPGTCPSTSATHARPPPQNPHPPRRYRPLSLPTVGSTSHWITSSKE